MADGILGLGSSGSTSLNQELIDKLKEAERKSTVEPIEESIEEIIGEGGESETLEAISAQVDLFLDTLKPFDLFVQGGVTAFDQKSASVSGSSVIFDAIDVSSINEGTTTVKISQLAQRDVYQSNSFSDKKAEIDGASDSGDMLVLNQSGRPVYQSDNVVSSSDIVDPAGGSLVINIDGVDKTFNIDSSTTYSQLITQINSDEDLEAKLSLSGRLSINSADEKTELSISGTVASSIGLSLGEKYSTEGKSYEDLITDINKNSNYIASVEQVGEDSNRIVIKSVGTGLENKINITQVGFDIGLEEEANNTVKAQNLQAKVDGIDYDVSSNTLYVDGGLKITAVGVDTGESMSSISVEKDNSTVSTMIEDMVTQYNTLVGLVDNELFSADSTIDDKSTLRTMMEGIKSKLFETYGENSNLSIFNFGIELDKSGYLSIDSEVLNEKIESNIDDLKSLFVGVAENRGLGTELKEYVDSLDSYNGLLSLYEDNILERKEALEEEKTNAIETLDEKYSLLATQFASYTALISQFEAQFSGLSLMIEQSTAS